jgi:hypothetical protein
MPDAAIENAVAVRDDMTEKIAAAEVQIREWRAKKDRAERFIADWEEFSGLKAPAPSVDTVPEPAPRPTPGGKPKNPKKEEVASIAREILLQNGEPMSRDELYEALVARGVIIHGGNPAVVLQTMLWRMQSVIVHLKGFGYWPADEAYQAADYVSAAEPDEMEEPDDMDSEAKSLI